MKTTDANGEVQWRGVGEHESVKERMEGLKEEKKKEEGKGKGKGHTMVTYLSPYPTETTAPL